MKLIFNNQITKYVVTIGFTIGIVLVYQFVDVSFFSLDWQRTVRISLFNRLRVEPRPDHSIIVFNAGTMHELDLQNKIDSLLLTEPRKIGVNLCHWDKIPVGLLNRYRSDDRVVFASCRDTGVNSLAFQVDENNEVTHFKTDQPDYFELKLADFYTRGNDQERIYYGPKLHYPISIGELNDSYHWFNPEGLYDKTILIGYLGDYVTDSIYYYTNCRVTPLNEDFGKEEDLPDMYDIEISAHIIRAINQGEFINEVHPLIRGLTLLGFCILQVVLLTFIKTRKTLINLCIAAILFMLFTFLSSALIVFVFAYDYYLNLDELSLVLLVVTVFTVGLNLFQPHSQKAA
ncbi:MAG: hypothetical protein HYZ44_11655 [Bacteroidetes bacterium]|nr:hypothetical protein [Bacteroidota bacterium]